MAENTAQNRKGRGSRRFVRWTLLLALATLLLAAGVVYAVDPFQHYRAMTLMTPKVDVTLQAYYNIGFARNYEYDTLLLGSSVTENTSTKQVEALFGGKAINLAFSGGTLPAYARMMDAAFDTRELERVFLCLDSFSVAAEPEKTQMHIPTYLYDKNPFNDVFYLLSWDSIAKVIDVLEYNASPDAPEAIDLDRLYYWGDQVSYGEWRTLLTFSFDGVFSDPLPAVGQTENMAENIDRYLAKYFAAYPDTEFYLFLPPYSALQWYSEDKHGMLERQLYYRSYISERLLEYPNVRLFDFQANRDWVESLDYYKDMAHYSPEINQAMTDAMAQGAFRVTNMDELEANNEEIRAIAKGFTPPSGEQLEEWRSRSF